MRKRGRLLVWKGSLVAGEIRRKALSSWRRCVNSWRDSCCLGLLGWCGKAARLKMPRKLRKDSRLGLYVLKNWDLWDQEPAKER